MDLRIGSYRFQGIGLRQSDCLEYSLSGPALPIITLRLQILHNGQDNLILLDNLAVSQPQHSNLRVFALLLESRGFILDYKLDTLAWFDIASEMR